MYNIETKDHETIIAQCTPSGQGAIALIRLCGQNVRQIVSKIAKLPNNKKIENVPNSTVNFGWIVDENSNHIDQVLFIVMDGPATFTGQNTIEITCHNNPFLIESIINLSIKHGARIANEGEFTKRAFLNGKIDLLQAEAINELIHANTQLALKKSLSQLEGSLSFHIAKIEKELIRTLAWCEASFEFLDEEQEFTNQIINQLNLLIQSIENLKKTYCAQQQIRQGVRITLIGSVNVGKSSIFNTILNQNRAIVTNIAGTTRDVIEAGIYRNGNYWTLVDTAGLRQTDDIIEKEGIKRSYEEAQKADIIILIFDGSKKLTDEENYIYLDILKKYKKKTILVKNKEDLPQDNNHQLKSYYNISFSNITKENLNNLEELIEKKISDLFAKIESPFLLNKRQYAILCTVAKKLSSILNLLDQQPIQYELVSYHLRDTLEDLSELTGKSISEAGLDMVFKEFCVGK